MQVCKLIQYTNSEVSIIKYSLSHLFYRFDELQPSLFPMLLLLARLYPSTFDDSGNPSMSLKPFVPLVMRYVQDGVVQVKCL